MDSGWPSQGGQQGCAPSIGRPGSSFQACLLSSQGPSSTGFLGPHPSLHVKSWPSLWSDRRNRCMSIPIVESSRGHWSPSNVDLSTDPLSPIRKSHGRAQRLLPGKNNIDPQKRTREQGMNAAIRAESTEADIMQHKLEETPLECPGSDGQPLGWPAIEVQAITAWHIPAKGLKDLSQVVAGCCPTKHVGARRSECRRCSRNPTGVVELRGECSVHPIVTSPANLFSRHACQVPPMF
ncbi:hypothetical protein B0T16DRAFT_33387 [Cercophora newfieldiana]|uniref:Uncharacterized protein n=1 Tax=Cercophora newfieldiana TaxID=92897 RepID=A0AA39YRX0_9PEZI|nr:hypothetical protein B0T16DRAFT_33387 [Cercophora newfieldiana]